jgi:hypothetical protein
MSSEIALSRVVAVPASMEAARDRPMPQAQPYPADRAPDKLAPAAPPNPTLRLDFELEIVVLEFRDDNGRVRNTIPTEQQLAAYRSWDRTQSGDPPRGHRASGVEREALRNDAKLPETTRPETTRPVTAPAPEPATVNASTTQPG